MSICFQHVATRWQLMAESFATQWALNHFSALLWLMVSQMWFSKAMESSWNTTLKPDRSHVSHKLSLWPSERCVSVFFGSLAKPKSSSTFHFRLIVFLWLTVWMASCWRTAVYSWAPTDGAGRRCCLHDQSQLCRQFGWEQVCWEVPQRVWKSFTNHILIREDHTASHVFFMRDLVSQISRWTLLFLTQLGMNVLWRWKSAPALKDTEDHLARYTWGE